MELNKKKYPLVSVITVVFNGQPYIEETILSVINQNYPNIEFIVIDGGSSDGTVEILERYKRNISKCVVEKDEGIYDAMNKGLKLANGEWVNFLNGGDKFYSNETLSKIFADGSSGNYDFIYGDSVIVSPRMEKDLEAKILNKKSLRSGMSVCHQSMFARKTIAPLYNLEFKYKAEYNWVLDIFDSISESRSNYRNLPVVYYVLGGFSERGLLTNLKEFMAIINSRFGIYQSLLNTPIYILILLRFFKYNVLKYDR